MARTDGLNTLWIGNPPGPVERACFRSVLRQGHALTVYSYGDIGPLPEGVEAADAAGILPPERIIRHESGSVALFADLFRYELQRRGLGVWVDADMYFVRPLDTTPGHIFGFQSAGVINNAVLKLPADSPVLRGLLEIFEETGVPFWLKPADRDAARERLAACGRSGVAKMPWGATGPNALTALATAYGADVLALPEAVFYPQPYRRANWILDPHAHLDDHIRPGTVAVHLWNELIKDAKAGPAPDGSFLARLQAEGC